MTQRYLMPFLVVVLSLAVYFLYIDAAYNDIMQKLAIEKVIDGYLVDAKDARTKLDKIISDYNAFPPDADARLNILLPEKENMLRLIVDINAVAEKNGLILKSPTVTIGVPNPDQPSPYVSHKIKFNILSTYPVFRIFLHDLQSSLALRDFSKVTFEAPQVSVDQEKKVVPHDPAFDVYDYQVELTTYSLH